MNFKKAYKKSNGYTPISKIGECSLKKLEFGIIELEVNESLEFYTEDKETAFIMLEGHCDVEFDGEKYSIRIPEALRPYMGGKDKIISK